MVIYVANEAMRSKFKPIVVVSSESIRIQNLCQKYGVDFIKRPKYLANDKIEKQEVVVHAFKKLKKKYKPSIIVSLQVNTPQFNYKDLDKRYHFLKKNYIQMHQLKNLLV